MIQILFLRHGQTAGNEERRYIGRTDEPLSASGRRQICRLRDAAILPKVAEVFCSPMRRCRESTELLYPECNPVIMEEFREIDFGAYEGRNAAELLQDTDSGYQQWIDSGGTMTFPEGEPREAFIRRSRLGFRRMMKELTGNTMTGTGRAVDLGWDQDADGGQDTELTTEPQTCCTAAAVVHGGTIMAILSGLFGGDYYDYQCRNAEGYRVILQPSKTAAVSQAARDEKAAKAVSRLRSRQSGQLAAPLRSEWSSIEDDMQTALSDGEGEDGGVLWRGVSLEKIAVPGGDQA